MLERRADIADHEVWFHLQHQFHAVVAVGDFDDFVAHISEMICDVAAKFEIILYQNNFRHGLALIVVNTIQKLQY